MSHITNGCRLGSSFPIPSRFHRYFCAVNSSDVERGPGGPVVAASCGGPDHTAILIRCCCCTASRPGGPGDAAQRGGASVHNKPAMKAEDEC